MALDGHQSCWRNSVKDHAGEWENSTDSGTGLRYDGCLGGKVLGFFRSHTLVDHRAPALEAVNYFYFRYSLPDAHPLRRSKLGLGLGFLHLGLGKYRCDDAYGGGQGEVELLTLAGYECLRTCVSDPCSGLAAPFFFLLLGAIWVKVLCHMRRRDRSGASNNSRFSGQNE
ncbi:uncharacterized protein LY89DRAFT_665195 [Mollisia scopiformis]|uniref:Uncharacterized protein n=1 Tax=Mollisia scopiformis TaxID=149040 RepID=A0A194XP77_MOLSC|nr:uncharacterized protein LY89DRAFT_665195 [Mollisia scopiformis]KUJ22050.1 hypothetical protein LY89DRAFT_665195 [Mollisia scopiformis]